MGKYKIKNHGLELKEGCVGVVQRVDIFDGSLLGLEGGDKILLNERGGIAVSHSRLSDYTPEEIDGLRSHPVDSRGPLAKLPADELKELSGLEREYRKSLVS